MLLYCLGLALLSAVVGKIGRGLGVEYPPYSGITETLLTPESRLAAGLRFSFATADLISLELIPGVSDTLATNLLARRGEIVRAACQEAAPAEAFELAHGVGPVMARTLAAHLDARCSPSERSSQRPGSRREPKDTPRRATSATPRPTPAHVKHAEKSPRTYRAGGAPRARNTSAG